MQTCRIIHRKLYKNMIPNHEIHGKSIQKSLKKGSFGGLGRSRDGLWESLEPIWAPSCEKERKQRFVAHPPAPKLEPKFIKNRHVGVPGSQFVDQSAT